MSYRTLGKSGLKVSVVGLGANNFGGRIDLEASRKVIDAAIEHGINFFDTADVYGNKGGSESIIGEVLGARRKQVIIATKFGNVIDEEKGLKGASRQYIVSAVEASLKRLKTDWIDLYQLHRPDAATPIDETLRALDDLIRSGKVRYIGASNLPAWQVVEAQYIARELGTHRFISSQDEYSLLKRDAERELLPALNAYGIGLLPFFPLANGLLTGKYKRGEAAPAGTRLAGDGARADRILNEHNLGIVERLEAFARERNHSLLELAFSWLLANPAVSSVIAGATRPEQIEQNVKAAGWLLSAAELEEIDRIAGKAL
ncbi:aldo/keto reductase [Uliginosibacterium sp. H3]|uniref:Aldo/keto reductase n=1 Tax=Uliginosibacterium silvisoli TaxID=3114758 RepID=A0ABU6K7P1_9RHOO|nr:aldo/keto reductase [Uliginosibacterium sp. H3]